MANLTDPVAVERSTMQNIADAIRARSAGDYYIPITEKGVHGGVATLDAKGVVPYAQAPYSRPNLLDNWYFKNPVNQRGQTEYTGAGYTIDRWYVESPYGTIIVNSEHITWKWNRPSTKEYDAFIQKVELERLPVGKTITVSFLASGSGNLNFRASTSGPFLNNITLSSTPQLFTITGTCAYVGDDYDGMRFIVEGANSLSGTVNLYAVKLELGDQQTLAHQDANGNWVLSDPPPNYQQELAKCQRYQLLLDVWSVKPVGFGMTTGTEARILVPTPVTMRTVPTVVFTSGGSASDWYVFTGTEHVITTSIRNIELADHGVVIRMYHPETQEANVAATMVPARLNGAFLLDANL